MASAVREARRHAGADARPPDRCRGRLPASPADRAGGRFGPLRTGPGAGANARPAAGRDRGIRSSPRQPARLGTSVPDAAAVAAGYAAGGWGPAKTTLDRKGTR